MARFCSIPSIWFHMSMLCYWEQEKERKKTQECTPGAYIPPEGFGGLGRMTNITMEGDILF